MRVLLFFLGIVSTLAGCGGGASGSGSASDNGSLPTLTLSGITVQSHVALGTDTATTGPLTPPATAASYPVVHAAVTLYDVATWTPVCRTGVGITDGGGGKIQIDTACLHDLNVVKVNGGQVNATPVLGTLHAILTRDQLLSGQSNITPLTEAFYAAYGYLAAGNYSVATIRAALDQAAPAVITQDITQDGAITYDDIVRWQPSDGESMLRKSLSAVTNALLQGVAVPLSALPTSPIFSATKFSPQVQANDTTVAVALSGTTAYALNSSRNLFIADVSHRSAPVLLGQLDLCSGTPPNQPCNLSINAIAVASQYAVVVGSQLHVVDVSAPAHPVLKGSLPLTGVASGLTVVGTTAYVAAGSQGLLIVNIADPTHPVVLAQLSSPGSVFGVQVIGQTAYVAAGLGGLQIVDVTNPAAPTQVGVVKFTTPSALAYDVTVVGGVAYVAAGLGGLEVVDVTHPSSPTVLSVMSSIAPRRLVVQNNVLYVVGGWGGLALLDITQPGVLALRARIATNSGSGDATDLAVGGDTAYVAYGSDGLVLMDSTVSRDPAVVATLPMDGATLLAGGGDTLYVGLDNGTQPAPLQAVNIADPMHPQVSSRLNVLGSVNDMRIVGGVAFMADSPWGLQTVDLASGAILSKSTDVSGSVAMGLAIAGNRAFVANRNGFSVADIANPSAPSIVGGIATQKDSRKIVVDGALAYVAQGLDGIGIFDIGNFQSPLLLSDFNPSTLNTVAYDLTKRGDLLYIADGSAGLSIVDVTNPASPATLTSVNTNYDSNDYAQKVEVDGAIAYIANSYAGVKVYDVSDPHKPLLIGQVQTPGFVVNVHVIGNYVYIADQIELSVIRAARQPWLK